MCSASHPASTRREPGSIAGDELPIEAREAAGDATSVATASASGSERRITVALHVRVTERGCDRALAAGWRFGAGSVREL
jgi:hypothetical protein